MCCDVRAEKEEINRTRITAGGNLLEYLGDVSTKTAGLKASKIVFNSVISTPGAKFMTIDISNMYLNTPLQDYQYMRFNIKMIPQEVIDHYNLQDKVIEDGWIYYKIRMAIYRLEELGKLSNVELQTVLASEGYEPRPFTHGLYRHKTRPIAFSLVVDDFGVKYINVKDAEHLENTVKKHYPIKTNWKGNYYLGMILDWNYNKVHNNRAVTLSMPGSVKEALLKFQHEKTTEQFAASPYKEPIYGKKAQLPNVIELLTFIKKQVDLLQRIFGKFLYYARAIDNTIIHVLNDLASQVTSGTMKTGEAQECFLNYCATNPDATIKYRASDMIIRCDSDAAYLVASKARSRAAVFIYMGNKDGNKKISMHQSW